MTDLFPRSLAVPAAPPTGRGGETALRIAESAMCRDGRVMDLASFRRWFADLGLRTYTRAERVPLEAVEGWSSDPVTGNIGHRSGGFFTIEGLDVRIQDGPVPDWRQPIINQPEVGILGILVKEFDGVLHCLMQAKVEPGNCDGPQLSPTVQATRSNYTRVHQGRPIPYLEYFQDAGRHRLITDVRQSEQGSAFHRKRNRNMVVEVTEDVELLDGFCWLTVGQLHRLLAVDDLVNMDARTVLSCLPVAHPGLAAVLRPGPDGFRSALVRSCDPGAPALWSMDDVLSWITDLRSRTDVRTGTVPLNALPGWRRVDGRISHESGRFFDVIGVRVEASGREVSRWSQPMIEPHGMGVVAFLVRRIDGVLHVLVHARVEAGYVDVVELAPTVQCTPDNYEVLPRSARPRWIGEVERARPGQIRYDAVLSEEGGRFYHARNRYLIIETDLDVHAQPPDHRWLTVHQLGELLRHSHYVNIQARSLIACLHSLSAGPDPG
ncbi:NDP-hexose 2,3-dehydratase family protein [Streptosporangium sp. LJ11]|uniref:NDP-hexose 2,3-dehydratase family protein n=1 Tax=Streptosporangium sp. LJ11 TaxID=3436927 RepID=UPI003F7ADA77